MIWKLPSSHNVPFHWIQTNYQHNGLEYEEKIAEGITSIISHIKKIICNTLIWTG